MSSPKRQEQLVSAAALALYVGLFLVVIWMYAHDYARSSDVADPTGVDGLGWFVVAFILPLLVGVGIGRYWAPALVVTLFFSANVAEGLEPLQRPEPAELETSPMVVALFCAIVHVPLLLIGAWIRKRLRPRARGMNWLANRAPEDG